MKAKSATNEEKTAANFRNRSALLYAIHFLISTSFLFGIFLYSLSLCITMLHESSSEVRVPPIESLAIFVIVYKGNKSLHTISCNASTYNKKTSNVFPTQPKAVMYSEKKNA